MSEFINILIQSNTLNFLIVLALIIFLIKKLNVSNKLQNLADEIANYVNSSETEKNDAQKKLDIINGKVQKLPDVIERIKKSTENSIKNYENKVKKDLQDEKNDISKNADRLFKLETKKFKNKLTNLLSEKSVELARENAIEQLNGNVELHNRYIDSAIDELDRINLWKQLI